MYKCNVCGRRFRLLAKNRYEVVKRLTPTGLNLFARGTIYYNAFDCPHCGCQNIVGVLEKVNVRDIEEQPQESEAGDKNRLDSVF